MQTSSQNSGAARAALVIGLFVGAIVAATLGLLLKQHGPGNMGNGMLIGGAIAIVGIALAAWRAHRMPDRASPMDRHFSGTADERDNAILTSALAAVGVTTVPLTGLAAIALALGLQTEMVMAILLFAQLIVLISAYVGAVRRV